MKHIGLINLMAPSSYCQCTGGADARCIVEEASSQLTSHGAGFAAKLGVVFVRAVPAIFIKI